MRRVDASTERRLGEKAVRRGRRLAGREATGAALLVVGFLVPAIALAARADADRAVSWPLIALFVIAYAGVARIEFPSGSGYAVPTQLVFVPMLLLLPTPWVPLLVALANVLATLVQVATGRTTLSRVPVGITDAWFSLAPAATLCLLGAELPSWSHWPAYAAALAAQLLADGILAIAWGVWCVGARVREMAADLALASRVDVLLAPVGLLAAIAAAHAPAVALLVLAPVALLAFFARERAHSIEQTLELSGAYRGTALLLRDVLEKDDEYTGRHTEDVVGLSVAVAVELGVDDDVRRAVELGALLHDIGKIAIPDEIINKPGPLDDDEWAVMRTHTIEGQRMLDRVGGLLADVGVVVRASHERWDGRGYPDRLVGAEIPLAARVVSACDAFNAMTTDRSYRRALPLGVAVGELRANAGTQFDPDVVAALCAVVDDPSAEPLSWQASLAPPAPATPAPAPPPPPQAAPSSARA
jgi:HD-GYP domain-containing protein (c-di-GMP phosphodiesterase class II)